ncbi:MAG: hypothetical protein V4494_00640 [Chlamydiota bacterium]
MRKKLGIVINFCTNEYRFLGPCIEAAQKVTEHVVVVVADHFFDGTLEDRSLLIRAYRENPDCQFLEFAFEPNRNLYGRHPICFWHNWGRLLGYRHFGEKVNFILFLDVDEILEPQIFQEWFECEEHANAERLSSYWYFKESTLRAKHWEDGLLLARRQYLSSESIMHHLERAGTYFSIEGCKRRNVVGLDGKPMAHHYSWVRSKQEMLRKVKAWGHRNDAPWEQLVEEEFSRPFNGHDFIYGDTFDVVTSLLPPQEPFFKVAGDIKNVRFISTDEMHRMELLC